MTDGLLRLLEELGALNTGAFMSTAIWVNRNRVELVSGVRELIEENRKLREACDLEGIRDD